jgi:hypothetical protein
MLFKILIAIPLAHAVCYIPFLSDPTVTFIGLDRLVTNTEFQLPAIRISFDSFALINRKRHFNHAAVISSDTISLDFSLLEADGSTIRHIYTAYIHAYNGFYYSPTLIIPSYGLGNLPKQIRWKVNAKNIDRPLFCNQVTAISSLIEITKEFKTLIFTDEFFWQFKFLNRFSVETIHLENEQCKILQYYSDGLSSAGTCNLSE